MTSRFESLTWEDLSEDIASMRKEDVVGVREIWQILDEPSTLQSVTPSARPSTRPVEVLKFEVLSNFSMEAAYYAYLLNNILLSSPPEKQKMPLYSENIEGLLESLKRGDFPPRDDNYFTSGKISWRDKPGAKSLKKLLRRIGELRTRTFARFEVQNRLTC